jgi:hypothetical protein
MLHQIVHFICRDLIKLYNLHDTLIAGAVARIKGSGSRPVGKL